MYHTILVPLDGSTYAERALPLAVGLAQAMKAGLVLVCACSATSVKGQHPGEAQFEAVADAQAYLAGVAGRLTKEDISVEIAAPATPAPEGILATIISSHADLVVMCSHGRSGLGRWIYGSVTEAMVARSPVPILLVRPVGPVPTVPLKAGQPSLLVALDGSAFSEAALAPAAGLAQALGAIMVLLRVVTWPILGYANLTGTEPGTQEVEAAIEEEEEVEAKKYLEDVAARLQKDGIDAKAIVRLGWPAEAILDEAKLAGASLIVMATHGRTGLRQLLLGSVALEVVHRGLLPLLLVRPSTPA
jgi:nucleotide-binding universal stress UspA family protein